ncbi:MAG: tetratricopeptide repeat protein [Gemmataceae bacterium]
MSAHESGLSSEELLHLESLCDQFEDQWKAGQPTPIGTFLAGIPEVIRRALGRELLAIEIEYRLARGERPSPNDYQAIADLTTEDIRQVLHAASDKDRHERRLGQYLLVETVGKGAYGTVWRAHDTLLDRTVAVKLAHPGLIEDPERFFREARAAANLRHPCIVRILDMGEAGGSLYIVREYIEGQSLASVIRHQPLAPRRAAHIAAHLASALGHSHTQGCIHRDLKPQNVVLDANDLPHLMDFGLAKSSSNRAQATHSGEFLGTPAYMAPEQACGDSRLADPRTDVYGLGVLLYQMLTSELPFRGSVEMIVSQILTEDPLSPARLCRHVPDDLASVCLKCMEKDPGRRYADAASLEADLQRFLDGSPTLARPLSSVQTLLRWAQRHPTTTALLATSASLTLAIAAGGWWSAASLRASWEQERKMRDLADAARGVASAEAEQSRQVTAFLEEVFASSDPIGQILGGQTAVATNPTARELVLRAVDRIETDLAGQPRVQARLLDLLGNSLRSLGAFESAERLLTKAASTRQALAESQPTLDLRAEEATHAFYRGWLHQAQGRFQEARRNYEQALEVRRQLPEELAVAEVEFQLGWLHLESRQPKVATQHLNHALEIRRTHLPERHRLVQITRVALLQCRPGSASSLSAVALASEILGPDVAGRVVAQALQLQAARARKDFSAAVHLYTKLVHTIRPHLHPNHPVLALVLGDFASCLWEAGQYVDAQKAITEAIRIGRVLSPHHPHMLLALSFTANEYLFAGRFEEADKLYREALAFPNLKSPVRFEITQGLIWTSLIAGRTSEALGLAQENAKLAKTLGKEHQAWSSFCLARSTEANKQPEEASRLDNEAMQVASQVEVDRLQTQFLDRMAIIQSRLRNYATVEKLLRRALSLEEARRPRDHPRVADRLNALAANLLHQNRPDEAEDLLRRALTIRELRLPTNDPRIAQTKKLLEKVGR